MARYLNLDHGLDRVFVEILEEIAKAAEELRRIRVILQHEFKHQHVTHVRIKLMPKTIAVGETATAHVTATKPDGTVFPITTADTLVLSAATPANVSFGTAVFNADGSADVPVTGVAAVPGDAISAMVDAVSTTTPDILTITIPAPATVSIALQ